MQGGPRPLAQLLARHGQTLPPRSASCSPDCISLLAIMDNGTTGEVATVGNEGLTSLPVFLGAAG